ncbi:MAG: CHAP domain-containing protein [Firmicutes bacterium]|nr:CHAP domain-containing protein [Bacillota bacterium]
MKKRIISGFLTLLILISLLPTSALAQNVAIQSDPAAEPVSSDEEYVAPIAKTIDEAADLLVKSAWEHYVITEIRWDNDETELTYDMVNEIIELAERKSGGFPFGESNMQGDIEKGVGEDGVPYVNIAFICQYYATDEQNTELCKQVDEVLSSLDITDNSSEYEVVCAIYDYICSSVTYDYENLDNDDYKLKYTAYAAMVNKTAVCNGYAMLASRMLTQAGISCCFVTGTNLKGCPHAWNIVGIDGVYYYVDTTWDAGKKPENYAYFLRGESDFTGHIFDDEYTTDEFKSLYPMAETRYIECPEHSFGDWTVESAATCTENGIKTRTCTNCGRLERQEIPALGHDYAEWVVTTEPTCTKTGVETGTCIRCGATETRTVKALEHDLVHHDAMAPSCTEIGWEAYDTCTRCDYTTYKEIPALGHDYAEWVVMTEPTCTETGVETGTCARCGATRERETAALGHEYKNGVCTRCGDKNEDYVAAPVIKITTVKGKPKISWSKVDSAVKYQVYRSTDGKTYTSLIVTTKTSVTNTSAKIGTTYYYKAVAIRTDGAMSDYSNVKNTVCKPAVPTVTVSRYNGKAKLSWSKIDGADKYYIYRSTDGKTYEYRTYTTKLSYNDTKSASGTKYYYKVRAVAVINDTDVASAYSTAKSIKTRLAAPTVTITTVDGKPSLSWNKVTGATGYYIFRSTDGKNYKYLTYTTKTSYINKNAGIGSTSYYKVKADDGDTDAATDPTLNRTAEKLVDQARAWLGCKEADLSNKEIIDIYNHHEPVARGCKLGYRDPWCAAFVSACAIKTGMTDIIPTECGCGSMVKLFQKIDSWDESDDRIPNVGDIIFFDWDDSGYGDNKALPGHVGIVEHVSGSTITVIDGNNKDDAVGRRTIKINGRFIRGYGVPKYDNPPSSDTRSLYSNAVSAFCRPSAPVAKIMTYAGKPRLSWKAIDGADKYYIYRSTDGETFKYYEKTTKTSYTDTKAKVGTKYYYKVKAARNVDGVNIGSAYSAIKTVTATLAKPTVKITTVSGKPKISWSKVTGADKYYVYRSTDGKTFKHFATTTKLSFINTSAKKGVKYYYKVKAVCSTNTNANSAFSTVVSIKATK